MTKQSWIIFAAVCVLLLGGLVYLSNQNRIEVDVSNINPNEIQPEREQSGNIADRVFGNPDSPVVLIEYGDYQCPGCASAHPIVTQVAEKYEDDIAFVYRNFPITTSHPNARAAASAAEAAGMQDNFWEMHNQLFPSQAEWGNLDPEQRTDVFEGYASDIGLDMEQFQADMTSQAVSHKINFDQALAGKQNVSSTPSFFLNGEPLGQAVWGQATELETAIQTALDEAGVDYSTEEATRQDQ